MCGGIRFTYDAALEPQLIAIYPAERLAQFRTAGLIETTFWQPRPVLPLLLDGALALLDWGDREGKLSLPKTGWARQESLDAGKWDALRPQPVTIPARQGVEKGVWFGIDRGLAGVVVERRGERRVYMLTVPPTDDYRRLTGHDRMPLLLDQAEVVPLAPPAAPQQTPLF